MSLKSPVGAERETPLCLRPGMGKPTRPLRWRDRASRLLHLALLATESEVKTGRFRSVKISGLLLAFGASVSVLLVTWIGAGDVADVVALRLLAYAAWLYGLLGLPALLHPQAVAQSAAPLAELRGLAPPGGGVRALGLSIRLALGMLLAALPGIFVAAVSSPTPRALLIRASLVLFSAIYIVFLAAGLGGLGALAERLAPRWPRAMALTLVLLPFLLSLFWSPIPNLPGAFLWAFNQLVAWGGLAV